LVNSSLGTPCLVIDSGKYLNTGIGILGRVYGRDEPNDFLKKVIAKLEADVIRIKSNYIKV